MKEKIEEMGIVINSNDTRDIAQGLAEVVEKLNEVIRHINNN